MKFVNTEEINSHGNQEIKDPTSTRDGSVNSNNIIMNISDKNINDNDEKFCAIKRPIDILNNRYPCCVLWTPLPLISWIIPIIGHTGISTKD